MDAWLEAKGPALKLSICASSIQQLFQSELAIIVRVDPIVSISYGVFQSTGYKHHKSTKQNIHVTTCSPDKPKSLQSEQRSLEELNYRTRPSENLFQDLLVILHAEFHLLCQVDNIVLASLCESINDYLAGGYGQYSNNRHSHYNQTTTPTTKQTHKKQNNKAPQVHAWFQPQSS